MCSIPSSKMLTRTPFPVMPALYRGNTFKSNFGKSGRVLVSCCNQCVQIQAQHLEIIFISRSILNLTRIYDAILTKYHSCVHNSSLKSLFTFGLKGFFRNLLPSLTRLALTSGKSIKSSLKSRFCLCFTSCGSAHKT